MSRVTLLKFFPDKSLLRKESEQCSLSPIVWWSLSLCYSCVSYSGVILNVHDSEFEDARAAWRIMSHFQDHWHILRYFSVYSSMSSSIPGMLPPHHCIVEFNWSKSFTDKQHIMIITDIITENHWCHRHHVWSSHHHQLVPISATDLKMMCTLLICKSQARVALGSV